MTNSMKDLLLGLGFKPPVPAQTVAPAARPAHSPSRADSAHARERPGSRHERGDASRHPNQRHPAQPQSPQRPPAQRPPAQRPPSQRHNPAHASAQPAQTPRAEQGARIDRPRRDPAPQRTREEIDLAKAYAIRAQKEKDERIEAERLKQEAARIKREAKAKVAELLKDKSLNAADAEHVRHFNYNGKIRRVHVTEAQLKSLNAGDLGVVQLDGRYLLVEASSAREASALLPSLLALLVDPDAPVVDDPYADPQYKVPDDLVW
jgi:uncharacterized protein YaiL (DUF2058 family)